MSSTTFTTIPSEESSMAAQGVVRGSTVAGTGMREFLLVPGRHVEGTQSVVVAAGASSIGSGADCQIRLMNPGIAEKHAVLDYQQGRLTIRAFDHRSWLNDGPLKSSVLRAGDKVTLGPVEYLIHERLRQVSPFAVTPAVQRPAAMVQEVPAATVNSATVNSAAMLPVTHEVTQISELRDQAREALERTTAQLAALAMPADSSVPVLPKAASPPAVDPSVLLKEEIAKLVGELDLAKGERLAAEQRLVRIQQQDAEAAQRSLEQLRLEFDQQRDVLEQAVRAVEEQASREKAHLQKQLSELQAASAEVTSQWGVKQAEVEQRERALANEQTRLAQENALLAARSEMLTQREAELDQTGRQFLMREKELSEKLTTFDDRVEALTARETTIGTRERELDEASAQLAQRESELSCRVSLVDEREAQLETKRLELDERADSLSGLQVEHQQRLDELTGLQAAHHARQAELEQLQVSLAGEQRSLQSEREDLARQQESQLHALAFRERELDARTAEWDAERALCTAALDQRRNELDLSEQQLHAQHQNLDAREAELASTQADLETQQRSLDAQRHAMDVTNAELSTRQADLQARQSEIDVQRLQLDALRAELDSQVGELETRTEQLAVESQRLEEQQRQMQQLQTALQAERSELLGLRQQLTRASDQRQIDAERRLEELTSQLTLAGREVDELHSKLANMATAHAAEVETRERGLAELRTQLEAAHLAQSQLDMELQAARAELAIRPKVDEKPVIPSVELENEYLKLEHQQADLDHQAEILDQRNAELNSRQERIAEDERSWMYEQRQRSEQIEERHVQVSTHEEDLAREREELQALRAELETQAEQLAEQRELLELAYERVTQLKASQGESPLASNGTVDTATSSEDGDQLWQNLQATFQENGPLMTSGVEDSQLDLGEIMGAAFGEKPVEQEAAPAAEPKVRSILAEMFGFSSASSATTHGSAVMHEEPESVDQTAAASDENPFADMAGTSEIGAGAEPEESEDSIANYMEKLLKRSNGYQTAERHGERPASTASHTPARHRASELAKSVAHKSLHTVDEQTEEVVDVPLTPRERPQIDKQAARQNLHKLRAVANQSARVAVAKHTWKQVRVGILVNSVLSMISWTLAVLLGSTPFWAERSFAMYGGLVALIGVVATAQVVRLVGLTKRVRTASESDARDES